MSIEQQVKQVIAEVLNFNGDLPMDNSIRDDLGADAIDIEATIIMLGMEFNIEIIRDDFDKVKTVRDAVDLVKKNIG